MLRVTMSVTFLRAVSGGSTGSFVGRPCVSSSEISGKLLVECELGHENQTTAAATASPTTYDYELRMMDSQYLWMAPITQVFVPR
jgi:hypothetical protein